MCVCGPVGLWRLGELVGEHTAKARWRAALQRRGNAEVEGSIEAIEIEAGAAARAAY